MLESNFFGEKMIEMIQQSCGLQDFAEASRLKKSEAEVQKEICSTEQEVAVIWIWVKKPCYTKWIPNCIW